MICTGKFKKNTATTTPTLLCTFLFNSIAQNKRKNKLKHKINKQNIYRRKIVSSERNLWEELEKTKQKHNHQGLSSGPPNVKHTI